MPGEVRPQRPQRVTCTVAAALCALLVLGGCRTGGGWTPAEPTAMERLPVQSAGRWGSITALRFGDYTADSVKISWARGSGHGVQLGGIAGDDTGSRQEYSFSVERANGARMSVRCHATLHERHVGFRAIEVQTSARYTYDCSIHAVHGPAWRLALVEDGDAGFTGALTTDGARQVVHTRLAGNRVTGRRAEAWELRDDGGVCATVDPRSRVVWLRPGTGAEAHRDAAAAAAAALLLYQRPREGPPGGGAGAPSGRKRRMGAGSDQSGEQLPAYASRTGFG